MGEGRGESELRVASQAIGAKLAAGQRKNISVFDLQKLSSLISDVVLPWLHKILREIVPLSFS